MSTWGWLVEYGIVALLVLLVAGVILALWGQDRWWRWQDRRDEKREKRSQDQMQRGGGDS